MQNIHFKAPNCWINDPNGFIWYKGQYHLFYQCFPYAPQWGRMHWGHAVSKDLVNWEEKGIALYPTKTDDRSGCFSGSAVEQDGTLYLFYTGVNYLEENPEDINQCQNDQFLAAQLMISSDDGMTFDNVKRKKTVIPPITEEAIGSKTHTRDPKVWRGKDAWYLVLGSSIDHKGRLLIYKSSDLQNWTYLSHVEKDNFGWMWECPDYFEIDGKGITVFSPMGFLNDGKAYDSAAICLFSTFEESTGTMQLAEDYQFLDYGLDLYAPQSTTDEDGNRIVIAWMRMPQTVDGKWNGMMCIPRVVSVKNQQIYFQPHPHIRNAFVKKISSPEQAGKSGYLVKTTLENGECINIGGYQIWRKQNKLFTDRSAVFVKDDNYRLTAETPVLQDGCELEIYVDSNLIEVYANQGEAVISSVVYGLSNHIDGEAYTLYTTE